MRYINFSAENLKALRKEAKLTQQELSLMLNVNRTLITQYETGNLSDPPGSLLKKLGKIFSQKLGHKIVFYLEWED